MEQPEKGGLHEGLFVSSLPTQAPFVCLWRAPGQHLSGSQWPTYQAPVVLGPALWTAVPTVALLGEYSWLPVAGSQRVLGSQQCPFNALQFKQGVWAGPKPTLLTWKEPMAVLWGI